MMRWAVAWLASLIGGCAHVPGPADAQADIRYVVVGPEGVAMARVITTAARCPDITLDGAARAMQVRMAPATVAQRPGRAAPTQSKPAVFPVLTCETVIPSGTVHAEVDGQALPLPRAAPRRIVVLGDTGCRILAGAAIQRCDDGQAWPFARVAAMAAATKPDLVLHVGDYHYRETACPIGNEACAGSPWGYGWDVWQADLFAPAHALLAVAPWVVVRGNHESCSRAGQGWWRFLDPRPVAPRRTCNVAADDDIGNFSDPYAVPLGADTQLVVFDSSQVGADPLVPDDPMFRTYYAQFERAFALASRTPHVLFTNHHPVLGFAANPAHPHAPYPGNAGLQSVLTEFYGAALFPPNVDAHIAGHNHVLEIVTFSSPHPPQIISGNGGDWVDVPFPAPFPTVQPAPGAVVAGMVASNRFGFLVMDRVGEGWQLTAHAVDGTTLTTCTLERRSARCTPILRPWSAP